MRRWAGVLLGQRARLRWLHLILGGALFMPYWLVGTVIMALLTGGGGMFTGDAGTRFGAYAVGVPLAAVTALFPLARPMSVAAARALCGVPAERFADGPARGPARTAPPARPPRRRPRSGGTPPTPRPAPPNRPGPRSLPAPPRSRAFPAPPRGLRMIAQPTERIRT
ncbi:hypothetical protein ACFZDF_33930 [Streptomyces sp. NPDC007910]|uniref:hypothetical protein n=1 Tax=Streptomyces sp. NPDC007910 TaxID=3364790 RepID=UPI0036E24BED